MKSTGIFHRLLLCMIAINILPVINAKDSAKVTTHPFHVPERAIVLTGDTTRLNNGVYAVFYNTENLRFNDPSVPRFQFIDRDGNTIFGVGGVAEGYVYYDFAGAIDNHEFVTYDIPVPSDPTMRSQFSGDVSHSSIYMKLARATKVGVLSVYLQSNFTGGPSKHDFKLKQAYIALAGFTAGLTNSTFSDPAAEVPTVDPQGAPGQITGKNILLSYRHQLTRHISGTLSIEIPQATCTMSSSTSSLHQRCPDIPLNLQYTWDSGSHIRAAAILRNLSYRNDIDAKNITKTGWGVMVAGSASAYSLVDFLYQAAYGHGIGRYVNDLCDNDLDLIPGSDGQLKAPGTFSFTTGLRFNPSKRLLISGSYGYCRLYDQQQLGADGFRRSGYGVVNAFYLPISELQIGLEYLHGSRVNQDHSSGAANRLMAMIKYTF